MKKFIITFLAIISCESLAVSGPVSFIDTNKTPLVTDLKTAQEVYHIIKNDTTKTAPVTLAQQITYENFEKVPFAVMQALAKTNYRNYDPVRGHPDVARAIVQAVVPSLVKNNTRWDLLNTLLRLNTTNIHTSFGYTVQNLVEESERIHTQSAQALARRIVNNTAKATLKNHNNWELMYALAQTNNAHIHEQLEKCIKTLYPNIESLVEQFKDYTPLDMALFCGKQANPIFIYAKIKNIVWKNNSMTQSYQHFGINLNTLNQQKLVQQLSPDIRTMFLDALQQEATEKMNGKFCFWRAETMTKLLHALVAKTLYNCTSTKKCPDNYYPLRATALIKDGLCSESYRGWLRKNNPAWNDSPLIYMNYALFANSTEWGSSTPKLLDLNMNWVPEKNSLEIIFNTFKCEATYKKYEKRIRELEEAAAKCPCGFLLMLVFNESQIYDYTYVCHVAGRHRTVNIDGTRRRNVVKILKALTEKPESIRDNTDRVEFCAIFGDIFGPESKNPINIKWYVVESMKPWLKKLNTLLSEIEAELTQQQPHIQSKI